MAIVREGLKCPLEPRVKMTTAKALPSAINQPEWNKLSGNGTFELRLGVVVIAEMKKTPGKVERKTPVASRMHSRTKRRRGCNIVLCKIDT
jgi:hypothetical protein